MSSESDDESTVPPGRGTAQSLVPPENFVVTPGHSSRVEGITFSLGRGRGRVSTPPQIPLIFHQTPRVPVPSPTFSRRNLSNMADPPRVIKSVRIPIKPPEYFGHDTDEPQDFLDMFEKVSKANTWSDEDKMVQFATCLRGRALSWYNARTRQFERTHGEEMKWRDLIAEFIDSNGPISGRKAMNEYKLMNCKQGSDETCMQYLNTMEKLCNRVDIDMPDERRLFHIKMGLRGEVLRCINPHNATEMEHLVQLLTKYDETTVLTKMHTQEEKPEFVFMNAVAGPSKGNERPPNSPEQPVKTPPTTDLSLVLKRLEKLERANAFNKRRLQDRRQIQVNQNNTNDQRNNFSARYNHNNTTNRGIPYGGNSQVGLNAPPVIRRHCYRCGSYDHLIRDCVTPVPQDLNFQQGVGSPPNANSQQ